MEHNINLQAIVSALRARFATRPAPIVDLIEAQTKDPFKILVATILSARTKDETTAAACRRLFEQVDTADDLASIDQAQLEKLIYPVGFWQTKAKHLKQLPKALNTNFDGKIPTTIDELVTLPGVGRKTANLVLAIAFKIPAVCVDTHVHRFFNRLGYIKTKTPLQTEMALRKKLPQKYWLDINSIVVSFGQSLCRPISPHCNECPIYQWCNRVGIK